MSNSTCDPVGVKPPAEHGTHERPTARQLQIRAWIGSYIAERGYAPSRREICDAFGFTLNACHCALAGLRRHGLITFEAKLPRTLRLTGSP